MTQPGLLHEYLMKANVAERHRAARVARPRKLGPALAALVTHLRAAA